MMFRLVRELADDGISVAVAYRVLKVPRSGYYDWAARRPSARACEDARLTETIRQIHYDSRCSYGAPRVHAELPLGVGLAIGRKRVARLMRAAGIQGISRRRKRAGDIPAPATQAGQTGGKARVRITGSGSGAIHMAYAQRSGGKRYGEWT